MEYSADASILNSNSSEDDITITIDPVSITWQSMYAVSTILTNAILLYILVFKIKDRNYSNMCFISLGLNDIVIGVVVMPTNVFYSNPLGHLNFYVGILITVVSYAQTSVGLYTLVLPTWHRFKQLAWPTSSTEKMNQTRKSLIIGVWVVIYLIWVVINIVFIFVGYYDSSIPDIVPPNYLLLIIDIFFYSLPMLIIVFLTIFTVILLIIRRRKKSRNLTINSKMKNTNKYISRANEYSTSDQPRSLNNAQNRLSRDTKAILCLISIIACLVLTQSVYLIIWPIYRYGFTQCEQVYLVSVWVSFSNSFFNPFILIVFHDSIQKALVAMFTCRKTAC